MERDSTLWNRYRKRRVKKGMNFSSTRFQGKRVLITGSSRGLGLAYAKAFAESGADVIINGRNPETLAKAEAEMAKADLSVTVSCFDVTDREAVKRAVDGIEEDIGPIDILVNNAGVNIRGHFLEVSFEDWDKVIQANLYSAFFTGQAAAIHMAKRKSGKIVNICSLLSEVARPGIPAYTVSKGGIKMLTKAMAIDLADYNIQVNGVGPGYVATEMNAPLKENEAFDKWITGRTPAGRWGGGGGGAEEEELCGAVLFLASDEANFITGQIMYVDGGVLSSL